MAQNFRSPFTVSDIRVDGLQRISAGTVFTYLPIERGDTLDRARAAEAIRALYKTGFFERRASSTARATSWSSPWSSARRSTSITLDGNKDIKTEDLIKGLKEHRPGRRRDLRPPRTSTA